MAKKKKFYTAKTDVVFKKIFLDENDYTLMEAILGEILGKEIEVLGYIKNELDVKEVHERKKIVDALIKADKKRIHLELNTNSSLSIRCRNLIFFEAFHSNETRKSDDYESDVDYYHIDLSFGLGSNHEPIDIYTLNNQKGMNYVENIKFYVVSMDIIKKFWYTNCKEEIGRYKYLMMIDLPKKELKKFSNYDNDELVNDYVDKVVEMNNEFSFDDFISPEEDNRRLRESERLEQIREAQAKGLAKGLAKGEEKGKTESQKEIALKMIELNIDIELVATATGLSIEKIEELINNNK